MACSPIIDSLFSIFTNWKQGYATNQGLTKEARLADVEDKFTSSLGDFITAVMASPTKVKKDQ